MRNLVIRPRKALRQGVRAIVKWQQEARFWIKRRAYRGYRRVRNFFVELRRRGDESSKGWMPMPEFERRLKACENEDQWLRLVNRPDVPLHLAGIRWHDDKPYKLMDQTLVDMSKSKHPHPNDFQFSVPKDEPKPKRKRRDR